MTNSLALVPVFAGTINSQSVQLCDARTLHTFMVVLRDFSNWIKGRIRKFGFVEGIDYLLAKTGEQVPHQGGTRNVVVTDYHLTLDMAKELAMVENNARGREARRYFIACEKRTQAAAPTGAQRWLTTVSAQGALTVEPVPLDALVVTPDELPELITQNMRLFTGKQVQTIAMQSNLRMMGVMGLCQENTEFTALKNTVRNLGGHDLYEIMKQGHMELSLRDTG